MKLGRALMVLIVAVGMTVVAAPADAHWRHPGWHGRRARVWWGPRLVVGYPYGYWGYPYPAYGYPPPVGPYASQKVYNGRQVTNDGGKETPTAGD